MYHIKIMSVLTCKEYARGRTRPFAPFYSSKHGHHGGQVFIYHSNTRARARVSECVHACGESERVWVRERECVREGVGE